MPRRKKYPKLPNGYGSIKYLGKGRRNPYAVHPPTTEFKENGSPVTPKALCYVDAWIKGFTVLTAFKAGNYYPGYEKTLEMADTDDIEGLAQHILADYNRIKGVEEKLKAPTFAEVYEAFYKDKYESPSAKTYSKASMYSTRAAFKNASALHSLTFKDLRHDDLQGVLNNCRRRHASQELILSLFHQMYAYADIHELVEKDYSAKVKIPVQDDDEHGVPFSNEELKILWENKENETVEFILIMCYSGFRIAAYPTLEVNLQEQYFKGGVKTSASKNRIVPIHSGIFDLVKRRLQRDGCLISKNVYAFRSKMYTILDELKIEKHTPHDCRHTFSKLCEEYNIRENDRKRMLGHSFNDVTNKVYGHRDLEQLKEEIEKIKICY